METFGTLFCGLGLFIIGVRLLNQNMKQAGGRQFMRLMARMVRTRIVSASAGFLSGVFTQSGNASVVITTGLRTAGLIPVERAMTMISWANIGTSVLVFMVAIDLRTLALYLLGLTGMLYYLHLDNRKNLRIPVMVSLGLGLLFLGVGFIKTGTAALESEAWVKELMRLSARSYLLLCLAGTLLTFILQSAPAVSVIAVSLTAAGIFSPGHTAMIVIGSGFGSAFNILFISGSLRGTARQLAYYQALFRVSGSVLILVVFAAFHLSGEGLTILASRMSVPVGQQVAFTYLLMVLLPAGIMGFVRRPVILLLEKMAPPSRKEELSKPEFLFEPALGNPMIALSLVEKEEIRLMKYLPEYLQQVSADRPGRPKIPFSELSDSFRTVSPEVEHYLSRLGFRPESPAFHELIMHAQSILFNMSALESGLREFAETALQLDEQATGNNLGANLVESLRMILDSVIEGFESSGREDLEIALNLTADRGDLLKNIRRQTLADERETDPARRQTLYKLTLLFERIIWILHGMLKTKLASLEP